jgi:hypothetical protein
MLRAFNPARDQILVWRQAGRCLEPPRKVRGAESGNGSHLLQPGTAFEVFEDVLDDRAEIRA